jgi:hypothetical protein
MLNQDYKDMLSALIKRRVDFVIVGAYAMAAHGYPRATGDIDIFVKPTRENAGRILEALGDFGAPLDRVSPVDFETPGTVFQIGVAPRRIDLLTEIDGITFEEAAADKDIVEVEGLPLPFISKEKLRKNKLASGREKDRLDAETLNG